MRTIFFGTILTLCMMIGVSVPLKAEIMFDNVAPVAELNSNFIDRMTHISSDGLTALISSTRAQSPRRDIFISTRPDLNSPFSTPVQGPFQSPVNSAPFNAGSGVLSSNGLELFYHHASSPSPIAMYRATRGSTASNFGSGSEQTQLRFSPNTAFSSPSSLSSDDLRMYLSGNGAMHMAERATVGDNFEFSAFNPFANINAAMTAGAPFLTPDELTAYFSSGGDIWAATRNSVLDPFGTAMLVNGVNTAGVETQPVLHGNTLFFTRDNNIFSATAAVPEPSSYALLAGATIVCGWRRRKRLSSRSLR